MQDPIETLLKTWHAVIGDKEITSSQILKRTAGGAQRDPAIKELRDALQALFPRQQINAQRLGMWLSKYRGIESGDLRLSGDYDSHKNRWIWTVFRPASIEQIESELAESAQRYVEAREKKLVGKGLDRRLKQLEKDNAKLESLAEERRASESDKAYKELAKAEAANVEAQQVIDAAEKRPRKYVYLAPTAGHFIFEDKTDKRCDDLRALGFKASVGYLSPSRFVIWIDGNPDMKELKRVAERFLIKINETEKSPASAKASGSEQVWDAEHQRWLPADWNQLDHTSIRLIRRALAGGEPERAGPAIRSTPFLRFDWKIFD